MKGGHEKSQASAVSVFNGIEWGCNIDGDGGFIPAGATQSQDSDKV